jgi:quercetin dioxygenase-like cupin family protein
MALPGEVATRYNFRAGGREAPTRQHQHLSSPMLRIRQEDLPFRGSSHQFVGLDQGETGISAFLFRGKPGSGPGPHRHPYDEVQFIQEGRALYTVDGKTFEAGEGDILVIKAGEVHSFRCVGEASLVQLDVHLSPTFIQENLNSDTQGAVQV